MQCLGFCIHSHLQEEQIKPDSTAVPLIAEGGEGEEDDGNCDLKAQKVSRHGSEPTTLSRQLRAYCGCLAPSAIGKQVADCLSLFSKEAVQQMVKERETLASNNKDDPDYDSLFPLPPGKSLGLFGPDSWVRQVSAIIGDESLKAHSHLRNRLQSPSYSQMCT